MARFHFSERGSSHERVLVTIVLALVALTMEGVNLGNEKKSTTKPDTKPAPSDVPPLQDVNRREVVVEYEVSRIGPSGIGSAELWWTNCDGREWENVPLPPTPDLKKGNRFHRVVDLQEGDGIYGFVVVVRSKAGRAKLPPQPGDRPQFRVELDTVRPEVQLFKPEPTGDGGLTFAWKAVDKNLSDIVLEWSETTQGPWQLIISGDLSGTGRHTWRLPKTVPVSVYIRVRARDRAGNEGMAVTPEPVNLDFTVPEARVVAVTIAKKE